MTQRTMTEPKTLEDCFSEYLANQRMWQNAEIAKVYTYAPFMAGAAAMAGLFAAGGFKFLQQKEIER